jgi:hypothetical protein
VKNVRRAHTETLCHHLLANAPLIAALAQEKRRLVCFRLAAAGVTTLSLAQE